MIVYVVTSGEYSSYGINAIFSTREKAEAYIVEWDTAEQDDPPRAEIEEWTVDDPQELRKKALREWVVWIDVESGFMEVREARGIFAAGSPSTTRVEHYHGRSPRVYASSCESAAHAEKLAIEARQKYRASR